MFERKGDKATCSICKKVLCVKDGNTTSMTRHAKSFHKTEWSDLNEKVKAAQPTIASCLNVQINYASSSVKRTRINQKLVGLIVKDLQPISIVEDEGFRHYSKELDPRYVLPTRKTLRETLIPDVYDKEMQKLQEDLDKAKHVGITTDMWTSTATDSFNTVTAHYLNHDLGCIQCKILECSKFQERHFAKALEEEIKRVTVKFKIDKKLSAGVSDNAQNIKKALKDLGIASIPCFAHSLNLTVHDAIKGTKEVVALRDKVAATVTLTHRSTNAKNSLERCQKLIGIETPKKLIQSVPTRWNSLFLMLERFLELKEALVLFFVQEKSDDALSPLDWNNIEGLVQVLRPLYDATVEISAEKFTTMSKVIPLTNLLLQFYGEEEAGLVGSFKNEICKSLKNRFNWAEGFLNYAVATMLDPRFKQLAFSTPLKVTQACNMAKHEALKESLPVESPQECPAEDQEPVVKKVNEIIYKNIKILTDSIFQAKGSLWDRFDKKVSQSQQRAGSGSSEKAELVDMEMKRFMALPIQDRETDPIKWWVTEGKPSFPYLYEAAIKHLVCPATSVPSERVFSTAGEVLSKKRNRLGSECANMIITLHSNMRN